MIANCPNCEFVVSGPSTRQVAAAVQQHIYAYHHDTLNEYQTVCPHCDYTLRAGNKVLADEAMRQHINSCAVRLEEARRPAPAREDHTSHCPHCSFLVVDDDLGRLVATMCQHALERHMDKFVPAAGIANVPWDVPTQPSRDADVERTQAYTPSPEASPPAADPLVECCNNLTAKIKELRGRILELEASLHNAREENSVLNDELLKARQIERRHIEEWCNLNREQLESPEAGLPQAPRDDYVAYLLNTKRNLVARLEDVTKLMDERARRDSKHIRELLSTIERMREAQSGGTCTCESCDQCPLSALTSPGITPQGQPGVRARCTADQLRDALNNRQGYRQVPDIALDTDASPEDKPSKGPLRRMNQ